MLTLFSLYQRKMIARKAAVIAFYSVTALAPLLILATTVGKYIFSDRELSRASEQFFSERIGSEAAGLLAEQLANTPTATMSIFSIIAVAITLVSIYYIAYEFVISLHSIFILPIDEPMPHIDEVKKVNRHSVMVGILLALLIIVNVFGPALVQLFSFLSSAEYSSVVFMSRALLFIFSLIITFSLFKVVAQNTIAKRVLLIGALITTLLSAVLDTAIALYAEYSPNLEVYGAASYLVVLLLWLYLSAQVFFIGAIMARYISLKRKRLL